MKRVRQIYNSLMRAVKEGSVPFDYYGPETCRWATPDAIDIHKPLILLIVACGILRGFFHTNQLIVVFDRYRRRFLSDVTPLELQSPRFQ